MKTLGLIAAVSGVGAMAGIGLVVLVMLFGGDTIVGF